MDYARTEVEVMTSERSDFPKSEAAYSGEEHSKPEPFGHGGCNGLNLRPGQDPRPGAVRVRHAPIAGGSRNGQRNRVDNPGGNGCMKHGTRSHVDGTRNPVRRPPPQSAVPRLPIGGCKGDQRFLPDVREQMPPKPSRVCL